MYLCLCLPARFCDYSVDVVLLQSFKAPLLLSHQRKRCAKFVTMSIAQPYKLFTAGEFAPLPLTCAAKFEVKERYETSTK